MYRYLYSQVTQLILTSDIRDCLDNNLHLSILSALAANLASSSTQDDLGLLTDSFSDLEPVTNATVNGVLSRLSTSSVEAHGSEFVVRALSNSRHYQYPSSLLANFGTLGFRLLSKWNLLLLSPSIAPLPNQLPAILIESSDFSTCCRLWR